VSDERAAWERVLAGSRWEDEGQAVLAALAEAAPIVNDLYRRAAAATYEKTDGSPVTDADLAADAAVRRVLSQRFPADAQLTEEGQDDVNRLRNRRCWIVDPIDGTQQFVERTGNFDILIALAVDGRPVVAGAVQPTTGTVCFALSGSGSWAVHGGGAPTPVRFPIAIPEPAVVATSIWFGAPDNLAAVAAVAANSGTMTATPTAIGFTPRLFLQPRRCDAVLGFRLGPSQHMAHEWDLAVGDLFTHEAGGKLTDLWGERFRYNQPDAGNRRGLLAAVHPDLHARLLTAVRAELAAAGVPGF
jgi:3'-phosphoadenosine 5'-phosphosulfate (PAPS) 3'-phosphatase